MIRDHKINSIAEQIYEDLEREILTGKYERGSVLYETKLCEELGVSRTPVREALKVLEREHFLVDNGKGLEVVGISQQDVIDMYSIRLKTEGDCAAMAAKNITEEELSEMGEICDLQSFYIDRQSSAETDCSENIKNLDSRFHHLLYHSSHSMAYEDMLSNIHKRITKFRKASIQKSERAKISLAEHREIYEVLKQHNSEKAKQLAEYHVKQAMNSIIALEEK